MACRPDRSSRGRRRARRSASHRRDSAPPARLLLRRRAYGIRHKPGRPRKISLPATGSPSTVGWVSVVVVSVVSVVSVSVVSVVSVSVVSVSVVSVVVVPSTVSGVAVTDSSPPQPTAKRLRSAARITSTRAVRRTGSILYTGRGRTPHYACDLQNSRERHAAALSTLFQETYTEAASRLLRPFNLNARKISVIPRDSATMPT